MRIHDWIYEIVSEICWDREYLYACYARHFSGLMDEVLTQGRIEGSGRYEIAGLKSGRDAVLRWALEHRADLVGSNVVTIECEIQQRGGESIEKRYGRFELSSGDEMKNEKPE